MSFVFRRSVARVSCFVLVGLSSGVACSDRSAGGGADGGADVHEPSVHPAVNVTTNYNTTGTYLEETYLNASNVTSARFGKLFTRAVDGDMYAQPLYVSALKMNDGKTHDVVFAATEHDTVYAFDADDPSAAAPLWQTSVGTSTPLPSPYMAWEWTLTDTSLANKCTGLNLREAGITSTPTIDLETSTIYVVGLDVDMTKTTPGGTCMNVDTADANFCKTYSCDSPTVTYKLHALDLATGAEKLGGPVVVAGSVPGTGQGSVRGSLTFEATQHLQRPSLLLANGNIYFATSSFSDWGVYHGWMFAYDKTTLKQVGVRSVTPNGVAGGIWQSGRSALADAAGNVYIVTGQGTFDGNVGGDDWGDTFLKLSPDLSQVEDYFTQYMSDYQSNNFPDEWDADLGSCGPTFIPGTTMALVSGKMGIGYLVDTGDMGKWSPTTDDVVQSVRLAWRATGNLACGSNTSWILGTPVAWVGPDGTHVFLWSAQDFLREYLLDDNGKFPTADPSSCNFCNPWLVTDAQGGKLTLPTEPPCPTVHTNGSLVGSVFSSGGALAVSSFGKTPGTGVLWATFPNTASTYNGGNSTTSVQPGVVAAFDPSNVATPLWTSDDVAARDALGSWAKFAPPIVASGKVYVGTFSKQLVAYGLLEGSR